MDEADKLVRQIYKQMHIRDKLVERIRWIEKKVEYRTRRIRELSAKRTEALNFTLPL